MLTKTDSIWRLIFQFQISLLWCSFCAVDEVIVVGTLSDHLVCLILLLDDGRDKTYSGIFSFDLNRWLVFIAFGNSTLVPRRFDLLLILLDPSALYLIILDCILAISSTASKHWDKLGLWTGYGSELWLAGADLVAAVAEFLLVCVASDCLEYNIGTVVGLIKVAR